MVKAMAKDPEAFANVTPMEGFADESEPQFGLIVEALKRSPESYDREILRLGLSTYDGIIPSDMTGTTLLKSYKGKILSFARLTQGNLSELNGSDTTVLLSSYTGFNASLLRSSGDIESIPKDRLGIFSPSIPADANAVLNAAIAESMSNYYLKIVAPYTDFSGHTGGWPKGFLAQIDQKFQRLAESATDNRELISAARQKFRIAYGQLAAFFALDVTGRQLQSKMDEEPSFATGEGSPQRFREFFMEKLADAPEMGLFSPGRDFEGFFEFLGLEGAIVEKHTVREHFERDGDAAGGVYKALGITSRIYAPEHCTTDLFDFARLCGNSDENPRDIRPVLRAILSNHNGCRETIRKDLQAIKGVVFDYEQDDCLALAFIRLIFSDKVYPTKESVQLAIDALKE